MGRVEAVHGLSGEVRVRVLTDRVAERFSPGARLWLGERRLTVAEASPHGKGLRVRFEEVVGREAAMALAGSWLEVPEDEAQASGPDAVLSHRLVGLEVRDEAGQVWGLVGEVMAHPANDMLVVEGARGTWLLPAVRSLIAELDVEGGAVRLQAGVDPRELGALER